MNNIRQNDNNKWKSVKIGETEYDNKMWINSNTINNTKKIPNTMNLAIPISSFRVNHIHFLDSKDNKIIHGTFSSMIYSDKDAIFNGIYLKIPTQYLLPYLKRIGIVSQNCKYTKTIHQESDFIKELVSIENDIINYYCSFFKCNKIATKLIQNLFDSASIKISNEIEPIHNERKKKLFNILKISGIWETETNVGITLKFIE
jgi:hypothetical protein